jgi:SAM-dependent methyltransferase
MSEETRTWHYGLVARWWAEFNQGGEDIEFFHGMIKRSGGPVLDAGCGTGRLLLPLLRAGIDIDGSDVSRDMLEWCRRGAESEQLSVDVYSQAMHELRLPRRYRTIIVCGAFGLGGTRGLDLEGLRRIHQHLEPGGLLVMDHHLPNLESPKTWNLWVEKPELPRPWPKRGDRRLACDGTELVLRVRQVDFDPLEQTTTLEIRASQYQDGAEIAVQTNVIDINLYFQKEIELMLTMAGFNGIAVRAFREDRPPRPWEDERIVFQAIA